MFIGNYGFHDAEYDDDLSFGFIINKLIDDPVFVSLNLYINHKIFPNFLTCNLTTLFFAGYRDKDIIRRTNDDIFYLNDRDLMIEYVKNDINPISYIEECLIRDKKLSKEILEKDYDHYLAILQDGYDNYNEHNFHELHFDMGDVEYDHLGFDTFIVNSSTGRSKFGIVVNGVNSRKRMDGCYKRYFYDYDNPRPNVGFFDSSYWNIEVVEMETKRLEAILDRTYEYLKSLEQK